MEKPSFDLEKALESLLPKRGAELEQAIESLRKEGLYKQSLILQEKLPREGRCPVCTLKIPCKHFQLPEEIRERKIKTPSEKLQIETPVSHKSFNLSITPEHSHMKIRYRGKTKHDRHLDTRKSDELEKLKLMEKLEKYKEEKLQRELQTIEEIKRIQEKEKESVKEIERKREVYYAKQKDKIKWYKEDLKHRIHDMERERLSFEVQERSKIQAQHKALEQKKQQLREFHMNQDLSVDLSSPQFTGQSTPTLRKKKYKFKSLKDVKVPKIHF